MNYATVWGKYCVNIGLPKCGFWVTSSDYRECLNCPSRVSMQEIVLLGPYLWLGLFTTFPGNLLPGLLQVVDLQTKIHMWFMHDDPSRHSLIMCFWAQWIGWGGPVAWPAHFTFKSLRFLPLGTSEACCLCYRSQWHPGLATPGILHTASWAVTVLILQHPALKLKSGHWEFSLSGGCNSETMLRKVCGSYILLFYCDVDSPSVGLVTHILFTGGFF